VCLAPREAWGGFTWSIFKNLGPNITLGIAGYFATASDWLAWEVVGIASAYIGVLLYIALPDLCGPADAGDALGTANLGANSVLGTSASLLYQLPYGLTVAAAVRV